MRRLITKSRRSYQRHTRRFAFLIALVLVMCGTGTAMALTSQSPSPEAGSGAATLKVFQHAPASTDALPAGFEGQLQGQYGVLKADLAGSREVTANDGQTAYLVPNQGGLCFINTNESLCAPSAHSAGAATVDLCSPSLPLGQLEMEWLLPDGATSVSLGMTNGTTMSFASGYNLYITRLPLNKQSPVPSTIQWDGSGGQHYSVRAPIPNDAQSEGCVHPGSATAGPTVPGSISSAPVNQTVTSGG